MLLKLIRKFMPHVHRWETTHTNRYMLPTRQYCRGCGLVREANSKKGGQLEYVWEYSDGTESDPLSLGDMP